MSRDRGSALTGLQCDINGLEMRRKKHNLFGWSRIIDILAHPGCVKVHESLSTFKSSESIPATPDSINSVLCINQVKTIGDLEIKPNE